MENINFRTIEIGDTIVHARYGMGKVLDKEYKTVLKQWAYHVSLDDKTIASNAWLYSSEINSYHYNR
jgi:hypothetical protein